MTKFSELKENEIAMDFGVELVSQAIISFPPLKDIKEYPDPADLLHEALKKGLLDLSKFKPVYLNYSGAEEDEKGNWEIGMDEWKDTWPFNAENIKFNVIKVDLNAKPQKKKKTRTITVEVEAPDDYTDDELKEELKLIILSSDGDQHLETMNWEPYEDVKFKVK
jgi:hypothetical protein